MKRFVTVFWGFALVTFLLACTWCWADAAPPAPPQNLRITSVGGTATESPSALPLLYVTMEWDPNVEPDLAGYMVYRGNVPGFPVEPATWLADAGLDTTFTDSEMLPNETYAWKVTAYNTSAEESGPSNEVTYSPPVSVDNATWGRIKTMYRW